MLFLKSTLFANASVCLQLSFFGGQLRGENSSNKLRPVITTSLIWTKKSPALLAPISIQSTLAKDKQYS